MLSQEEKTVMATLAEMLSVIISTLIITWCMITTFNVTFNREVSSNYLILQQYKNKIIKCKIPTQFLSTQGIIHAVTIPQSGDHSTLILTLEPDETKEIDLEKSFNDIMYYILDNREPEVCSSDAVNYDIHVVLKSKNKNNYYFKTYVLNYDSFAGYTVQNSNNVDFYNLLHIV